MKYSGIEWIGEIPANWDFDKGKYHFTNNKYVVGIKSANYDRLALTMNGVIHRNKEDNEGLQPSDFNTYQLLKKNELVFKLIDLQNVSTSRIGLAHDTGIVSPAYVILHANNDINPSFAEKFFLMMWYREIFNALGDAGVRSNLNAGDLLNVRIPVPPIDEQKKIADYLDKRCGEIDAITAEIQEQINTLEEYKKSVISEAVTKGLDNRDNLVKSRVFYMSPYNENWKLSKIGYECTKLNRAFSTDDIPLLCTNKGEVSNRPEKMTGKMVSEDNAVQGIHEGDIAIHGMDTWHGAIAISPYKGKITRVVHVCDSKQDNRFVVYYLKHLAYQRVYKLISNGIRENTSDFRSWEKVKDIYITFPNIEEQKRICDYLDVKKSAINDIITDKQKQIETLEEYKKTLIYEYVTGKKEVA